MKHYLKDTRVWIFIFLLLLLLISIIAYYNTQLPPSNIAVISQNGTCIDVIDLSQVTAEESIIITGEHGASNTINFAPGKIRILAATCPDQTCVRQGWIQDSRYPLVCLPNRLTVRILPSSDADLDTVAQ